MSSSQDSSITRQVFDFLRVPTGFRIECLRIKPGDERVSDVSEMERVIFCVWSCCGSTCESFRAWDLAIEDRWLKDNEAWDGDRGDFGDLFGGKGAGLGLTKRSGSSATSSRPGVNMGDTGCIAESSGVVSAWPTLSGSSAMLGSTPPVCVGLRGTT